MDPLTGMIVAMAMGFVAVLALGAVGYPFYAIWTRLPEVWQNVTFLLALAGGAALVLFSDPLFFE